jgi:hypothetical protein
VSGEKRPPSLMVLVIKSIGLTILARMGVSKDFKGRKEKNTPGIKTEQKSRGTIRYNAAQQKVDKKTVD